MNKILASISIVALAVASYAQQPSYSWEGKRIAVLGDSISDPDIDWWKQWWKFVGEDLHAEMRSYAVNGWQWSGVPTEIDKLVADDFDVDAILILMGTNDFNSNVPLGKWWDESDATVNRDGRMVKVRRRLPNKDAKTVRGRINIALEKLKSTYPDRQIVLMTPLRRGFFTCDPKNVQPEDSYSNEIGLYIGDYAQVVREASEVWSVPIIDAYAESGLVMSMPAYDDCCNRVTNDRLHPSTEGCRRLALSVASRLRTLPPTFRRPSALPLIPYPQSVMVKAGKCAASVEIKVTRDAALGSEAYRLEATPDAIRIISGDEAGEYYARKTLAQLRRADGTYPCVKIADKPALKWRGVLIDESRHFWGKEVVKRVLDRMADMKLNVLHWHLTDSHGWRIQIDRYPELTARGATRPIPDWDVNIRDEEGVVGTYGPFFYTKDEIREVIAYARARHIRVVPEIELPGHSRELILCHPNFTCLDSFSFNEKIRERKEVDQAAALCVGNDEVIRYLENILDEVCELFPDEYVHIGGDECPRGNWKECAKCQARVKANGLKSEDELQSWVTRHFAGYLAKKGKKIVGWDEILQGGAPEGACVMSWRGTEGGIAAAKQGHSVIMCPHRMCYLDYRTAEASDKCPYPGFCNRTFLPLEKVYSFDPFEGIPENQRQFIIGTETLNWGESTWRESDLDFKMWPRTCANAEIAWSGAKKRDYADFTARLKALNLDWLMRFLKNRNF